MDQDGLKNLPSGLAALMERAGSQGKSRPPVETWHPPFCGDLDIRISRDGSWSYLGSPIGREALVRLFSSVLRKDEDGKHYLVTPVEKIGIVVEDAPFVAVEMEVIDEEEGCCLVLRTNVGDVVHVDAEHPMRFEIDQQNGGLKPYVLVRGRLEALLSRSLLYQLAELLEPVPDAFPEAVGIRSRGAFYTVPAEAFG